MSNSLRHTPIIPNASCRSEKKDKQAANRKYRHRNKQLVKKGLEPIAQPDRSEWFGKDGKTYWIPWGWSPWLRAEERALAYIQAQRK